MEALNVLGGETPKPTAPGGPPSPREALPGSWPCACGARGASLTWDPHVGMARCTGCGRPQRLAAPPGPAAPADIEVCPREPDGLVPLARSQRPPAV